MFVHHNVRLWMTVAGLAALAWVSGLWTDVKAAAPGTSGVVRLAPPPSPVPVPPPANGVPEIVPPPARLPGATAAPAGAVPPGAVVPSPPTGAAANGGSSPVPPSIIHRVRAATERMELTVNTSRILTLDQKIPQAQVNNPDLLELHPLSPNEIQVFAKAPGVTQINLWGEDKKIYTVDVIVYGDAQALQMILKLLFPNTVVKAIPVANSVILTGYVDQPEHVSRIVEIAQEYYPKVINNMRVSGVQQVLLHVKVMEVSRTKLRTLGFDFAVATNGSLIYTSVSGLISAAAGGGGLAASGAQTLTLEPNNTFFGVLEALRQDNLMKILAEPDLVTVSGRPAFFNVGGEFPVLVPQGIGTVSIEYKKFGTQVDFVPIVLGNGRIRLEVRPRVSEIDSTRSVTIDTFTVPGLRTREAETGVELVAGQTLAIAGLVQTRIESENKSFPWLGELPWVGALFRRVREHNNEIETLILVTPELVEGVDAPDAGICGPGMLTTSPSDVDLFFKGHLEVPNCCPPPRRHCPPGVPDAGPGMGPMGAAEAPAGGALPVVPSGDPPPAPLPPPAGPSGPTAAPRELPAPTGRRPAQPLPVVTAQRPYDPQQAYSSHSRQIPPAAVAPLPPGAEPNFIGPVGYDVK